MPPSPLIPTWRLTFPYVCAGFSHVQHFYGNAVATADPSGYSFTARDAGADIGVSTIPAPWWTVMRVFYSAGDASFGNAHLDQLVATHWIPRWTEANAVAPSNGSPSNPATQAVISFYTLDHERMKVYLLEPTLSIAYRYIALPTPNAGFNALCDTLFNGSGATPRTSPFYWMMGRNGHFSGAFTSIVGSQTKHWRRKRGLG